MTRHQLVAAIAVFVVGAAAGSLAVTLELVSPAHAGDEPAAPNEERFHASVKAAAAAYADWLPLDGVVRVAPTDCRAPIAPDGTPIRRARKSASEDEATHGEKLYFLYLKDRDAYLARGKRDQPIGQVLVKESWTARAAADGEGHPRGMRRPGEPALTVVEWGAEVDGKMLVPDERRELFVMLKQDPKTDGTDGGWVYATTTPDGKTVTAAGRIASCIECHENAERDRMLGAD